MTPTELRAKAKALRAEADRLIAEANRRSPAPTGSHPECPRREDPDARCICDILRARDAERNPPAL